MAKRISEKEYIARIGRRIGSLELMDGTLKYLGKHTKIGARCMNCGSVKNTRTSDLILKKIRSCKCMARLWPELPAWLCNKINTVYRSIKSRCENPEDIAYERYGARGIECRISKNDFKNFLVSTYSQDEIKSLQIDRIDNNGHYEVKNIRLATRRENCRNRRNNRYVIYNGDNMVLAEAVELFLKDNPEIKLTPDHVGDILRSGKSFDEILATQDRKKHKQSSYAARNSIQNEGNSGTKEVT